MRRLAQVMVQVQLLLLLRVLRSLLLVLELLLVLVLMVLVLLLVIIGIQLVVAAQVRLRLLSVTVIGGGRVQLIEAVLLITDVAIVTCEVHHCCSSLWRCRLLLRHSIVIVLLVMMRVLVLVLVQVVGCRACCGSHDGRRFVMSIDELSGSRSPGEASLREELTDN